ncbi:MAG: hypothetical protein Rhirs2KO_06800 [Rhizobiaceae bacterium]
MVESLQTLTAVARLASAVGSRRDTFTRDRSSVVADLRAIRFSDDGILKLIDDLISANPQEPNLHQSLLTEFNDKEWATRDAIARLCGDAGEIAGISRLMRSELSGLAYGKSNIRAKVQSMVNHYLQDDADIDIQALSKLAREIRILNHAIDDAEDTIIHGR